MPTDGTVLAESHGRYVAASEARKRELAAAYGFRLVSGPDSRPIHPAPWPTRRRLTASEADAMTTSEVTARAVAFVEAHKPEAEALGTALAELSQDPDAFADDLAPRPRVARRSRVPRGPAAGRAGHRAGHRRPLAADGGRLARLPPGDEGRSGDAPPVRRGPAVPRSRTSSRAGSRSASSSGRWTTETERTWQLLRRAAREAGDWITVDSLAHPYGKGIAAEPYRWAELEQLVYSPSRWERRLIGSTIATMTHVDRRRGRDPEVAVHALPLLAQLMGDAEPDVQKALSWAYRSLTVVDMPGTVAALRRRDGHRGSDGRRPPRLGRPRYARQARSGRGRRAPRPPRRASAGTPAPHPPPKPPSPPIRFGGLPGPDHPPRTPARLTVARHRSSRP